MTIIKALSEHKKILLWLALAWTAVVAYLCLIPSDRIPVVGIFGLDKAGHFTFNFGITSFWFLYYKFRWGNPAKRALLKAFLFSLSYGILIEIAQALFTTTRKADIFDVFANMAGAVFAIIAFSMIIKWIKNRILIE